MELASSVALGVGAKLGAVVLAGLGLRGGWVNWLLFDIGQGGLPVEGQSNV